MEDKPIMNILTPNEDSGVLRLLFLYTVIGWLANKIIKLYINLFLHGEKKTLSFPPETSEDYQDWKQASTGNNSKYWNKQPSNEQHFPK